MVVALRVFFAFVLIAMLAMTTWASFSVPIWQIPPQVSGNPWFLATMADAYFGFLTFYCWVFYKERTVIARVIWLLVILLLGNIAMASYVLIQLFRLPAGATLDRLLLREEKL